MYPQLVWLRCWVESFLHHSTIQRYKYPERKVHWVKINVHRPLDIAGWEPGGTLPHHGWLDYIFPLPIFSTHVDILSYLFSFTIRVTELVTLYRRWNPLRLSALSVSLELFHKEFHTCVPTISRQSSSSWKCFASQRFPTKLGTYQWVLESWGAEAIKIYIAGTYCYFKFNR